MFSNGLCMGLNDCIPVGGHVDPSSIVGVSVVWKNDQKSIRRIELLKQQKIYSSS